MVHQIDYTAVKPFFHHPTARLSEGISYDARTDSLIWIDIHEAHIHDILKVSDPNPESRHNMIVISKETHDASIGSIEYPKIKGRESIGAVFLTSDPNIILFGGKFGIGKYNIELGRWGYVVLYSLCKELSSERLFRLRSNDGDTSPDGKYIFIGLMSDFGYDVSVEDGCIVKVSVENQTVEIVWHNIGISNAIHWNKASDKIFITDSFHHKIWRVPFDNKTNTIIFAEKESFIDCIDPINNNTFVESPEPDGGALDQEANLLYVCVWSTHKVQVYDAIKPNTLIRELIIPETTPRVSCCCIVGNDVFVTTGNDEISDKPMIETVGGTIWKLTNAFPEATSTHSSKTYLQL